MHGPNPHGVGLGGNASTGTPLTFQDGVAIWGGVSPRTIYGLQVCGYSRFLWAIPMLYSVASGPLTPFAGGYASNQYFTSGLLCGATAEKEGAGPVCRNINGTPC